MATRSKTGGSATTVATPSFFSLRGLAVALAIVAGFLILTRWNIPGINPYERWNENRLGWYYSRMDSLAKITDLPTRYFMRHTFNYSLVTEVTKRLRPGDTLLLPPRRYANSFLGGREGIWTDVRIFRYLAQQRVPIVAWEDTARRHRANVAIALEPTAFELLQKRRSVPRFDSIVDVYRTMDDRQAVSGGM